MIPDFPTPEDRAKHERLADAMHERLIAHPDDAIDQEIPSWVQAPGWSFRAWSARHNDELFGTRFGFVVEATHNDGDTKRVYVAGMLDDKSPVFKSICVHCFRRIIEIVHQDRSAKSTESTLIDPPPATERFPDALFERLHARPDDAIDQEIPTWVQVPGWVFRAWTAHYHDSVFGDRMAFVVKAILKDKYEYRSITKGLTDDGSPALKVIYDHAFKNIVESARSHRED